MEAEGETYTLDATADSAVEIIGGLSTQDPDKNVRMRANIIREIIDSEDKYIRDLYILILYYVTPLRKDKRFPELSNTFMDVTMLFSTVELIFDGNVELLEKLRGTIDSQELMIGQTFSAMVERICQYYGVFCNHQKEAMDQISEYLKTKTEFKQFEDSCKAQPETSGLGLLDYLVKPFQRMLKYPLLLKELLKQTPPDHPDLPQIENALNLLQIEVDQINKSKARSDTLKKMLEVNDSLEGFPKGFKLLIPNRSLVYEGLLKKISGNHDQERYFMLFNDCLMYSKKKSPGKYICRGIIYLNKLRTEPLDDEISFRIHRSDKDLIYILYGTSKKERDGWLREIKQAQEKGLGPSVVKAPTIEGEKKEITRFYVNAKEFKTIALTPTTTSYDAISECLRKMSRNEPAENYVLCTQIKDKTTPLIMEDKPYFVQQHLVKQGVKFNNETNHFKIVLPQTIVASSPPTTTKSNTLRKGTSKASFTSFMISEPQLVRTSNPQAISEPQLVRTTNPTAGGGASVTLDPRVIPGTNQVIPQVLSTPIAVEENNNGTLRKPLPARPPEGESPEQRAISPRPDRPQERPQPATSPKPATTTPNRPPPNPANANRAATPQVSTWSTKSFMQPSTEDRDRPVSIQVVQPTSSQNSFMQTGRSNTPSFRQQPTKALGAQRAYDASRAISPTPARPERPDQKTYDASRAISPTPPRSEPPPPRPEPLPRDPVIRMEQDPQRAISPSPFRPNPPPPRSATTTQPTNQTTKPNGTATTTTVNLMSSVGSMSTTSASAAEERQRREALERSSSARVNGSPKTADPGRALSPPTARPTGISLNVVPIKAVAMKTSTPKDPLMSSTKSMPIAPVRTVPPAKTASEGVRRP